MPFSLALLNRLKRLAVATFCLVMGLMPLAATASATAQAQTATATEWAHRHAIAVTNPNDAELRDFQVKVTLDETNFDFDRAQPDGGDLRFTDQSGTKYIPHWTERFDPQAKQATIWVKTPSLPASGAQTIYAYYGNTQAEDLSSGRRTFEMFDDFGQPGLGYFAFDEPTTIMTKTLPWETQAPHTFSVVEMNREGYRYWGYYGLADCGGIGIARSNDLLTWDKLPEPLLNKDGERWPSALKVGETIYIIYDRDHCGTSHLVLRTSKDGRTFDPDYTTIVALEQGVRNQNPALFQDPNTGKFHLYWFRGGAEAGFWQIKMRSAATVAGLADPRSERVLLDEPYELAAPNMMFRDGHYFLSTEVNENAWKTKIYAGTSPEGPFAPLPDAPQLSDNQACLFQHPSGDLMHGYICKIVGTEWVLNHRAANLGNGRLAQRVLDAGVWTRLGGNWLPAEYGDAFSAGIVLSATGQGLLRTALSGSDYVLEARGRLADVNAKWGLAFRAQDERNMYLLEVERFVNGGSYIRFYSVVDGQKLPPRGGMSLPDDDALAWTTLSVAASGNEFTITRGGRAQTKIVDPDSLFMSGHSGLWVDGNAQFDDVRWRKYAPQEPMAVVGPREDRPSTPSAWFSMARAAPVFAPGSASASPAETPNPWVNSPWLVAMAALATVIALGIVIAGFARNRIRG
jgi:hypothetical protein